MKIRELLEAITPKIRNPVAKAAQKVAKGSGAHKDKKLAARQGNVKHKKKDHDMAESATAGATSAGNVSVGAVYKNKKGKTAKNSNGTAKNALDLKGANLITGGSLVKR
jgi:hypothetical protein